MQIDLTAASSGATNVARARVLAFYLPQFHPIPENDEWWGAGFTEWTNVAKAKPLYAGHVQPRLPADLGFYDLRVPEVRELQAGLARKAGIESFCYWHYWFGNGRRILERPFEEVLASGKPDFPFCLAWANVSWTGVWHGLSGKTLVEQTYPGKADEEAHFRWAQRAFEDPRYSKVYGKPVFVVLSPSNLPSTRNFIEHWRELAHRAGYPGIYFVGIWDSFEPPGERYHAPYLDPFDAVTLLGPHDYLARHHRAVTRPLVTKIKGLIPQRIKALRPKIRTGPNRVSYSDVLAQAYDDMPQGARYLPSVLSGWDNTPRSSRRGWVYEGFTPELFKIHMDLAISRLRDHPKEERILFLKAWNEWAEGNI
ncbi:MAG TPA: glycoside hydrolase family 99-like domain-containing protein, partial [Rhizomicrobium sp.]|nr:glycoside hydrolase family 99-like domain-containing protein [Rhizomicrobium sp.]